MKANDIIIKNISQLHKKHFGDEPRSISSLPISGSDRRYFRLEGKNKSVIAAYNPIAAENMAFLEFTKHFHKSGLPVPEILCEDNKNNIYIISDLGDTSLFSTLPHKREQLPFSPETISIYKKVLDILPEFQIIAGKGINYDLCFPRKYFDNQSIMWDLNYFKYYFLKVGGFIFDEQKLEDNYSSFISLLTQANSDYFMYRDFQSRNIMLLDGNPYFIDYQGGRKGALQYDVASLLFDAKANMPFSLREELLDHYIQTLRNFVSFDEKEFRRQYYAFVLVRVFQAMGAYGFRGLIEKKPVFLQSIPYAINNLDYILSNNHIPKETPYFKEIASMIINSSMRDKYDFCQAVTERLTIQLSSFSYKKGIPDDLSGNGGGFVFDCRALPNPGREEKYKNITGLQKEVIEFLDSKAEVKEFIDNCIKVVELSIKNYSARGFTNLMVSFGCTGGQHRSVYCAEKFAKLLSLKFDIHIDIKHTNIPVK